MHADGGMETQVFGAGCLIPLLDRQGKERKGAVYLIRNSRVTPKYREITPKLANIGGRAIGTLIRMQGVGDILRNYQFAMDAGVDFRLAYIPEEFQAPTEGPFDPKYMNALFDFAFARAKAGYPWDEMPAGVGVAAPKS
jgi:hypothetical protein